MSRLKVTTKKNKDNLNGKKWCFISY